VRNTASDSATAVQALQRDAELFPRPRWSGASAIVLRYSASASSSRSTLCRTAPRLKWAETDEGSSAAACRQALTASSMRSCDWSVAPRFRPSAESLGANSVAFRAAEGRLFETPLELESHTEIDPGRDLGRVDRQRRSRRLLGLGQALQAANTTLSVSW